MKHLYQFLAMVTLVGLYSCSGPRYLQQPNTNNQNTYTQPNYSQQGGPITYQEFYNDLSPYGNWVNYGDYGYVWVPDVPDFRPYYSNGRWVYTDYGWTWSSDYNWGWAPFHYGRWINDMAYGWMWVPGYEWAPAWVSWRGGGDYYGWAPLGPRMDVNIASGAVPQNNWAFVPRRYINSPQVNNYYVDRSENVTIINKTTIINNTTVNNNTTTINNNNTTIINNNNRNTTIYNQGPSVTEVEQSTGTKIKKLSLVESNKPEAAQVNGNALRVYKPAVNTQPSNPAIIKPAKIASLQEVQNNRPNRTNNNTNTESQQPARQFPANQAPQQNRNGSSVNGIPAVSPNTNDKPVRRFLDSTQGHSMQTNRSTQPGNETNKNGQPTNNSPLKVIPKNSGTPGNNAQQNNLPVPNSANQSQPVRRSNNYQNSPTNSNNNANNTANPKTIPGNVSNKKPVLQNKGNNYQPNQKIIKGNNKTDTTKPAPHFVKPTPPAKKDGE